MIEINLVPDVKQELLRAQKARNAVISLAVVISVIAVGVVALLAVWIFLVQGVRGYALDGSIKDRSAKLAGVEDVNNTLTIQNQLDKLETMHAEKAINSRVFDLLKTINPAAPNDIRISTLDISAEDKTISIQAQANGGFAALEVFKKTLAATNVEYVVDGKKETAPLAEDMSEIERSYGEDTNGTKVVRFKLMFTYPEQLFSNEVDTVTVLAPGKNNVTDSYLGLPQSLFAPTAANEGGDN